MSCEEYPDRRRSIQSQRGPEKAEAWRDAPALADVPRIGPPLSDTRPTAGQATQG